MNLASLTQAQSFALLAIVAWSLLLKGIALWKAAQHRQTAWFVALLVINTIGILEIVYLNFFQKDRNKAV